MALRTSNTMELIASLIKQDFWKKVGLGAAGCNAQSIEINNFNLINDVWKTKGSCFGFILLHIFLKLVSWNQKGSFLTKPIINILNKHQLQNKISISSISRQSLKSTGKLDHWDSSATAGSSGCWGLSANTRINMISLSW
ncbi:hypothetical protein VP01_1418g3 [Puccinia sorghi]|uniref:Uncharacterized protein n=1 Tax=Puccinia sorghi TaxID=27349 RepID=A0A0L6VKR5_9BASI|nr:hypothetical protein VP01_1418g3 [Puccinia sorghi]